MADPVRYLSVCGMLGYGFPEAGLREACRGPLDFLGADAGSTDPGPFYLGSGRGFVKPMQVRRDLELSLLAARAKGIPLLIGSAGGSGARPHVDAFVDLLLDVARGHGLHFRLAVIHADVDRDFLRRALAEGRIAPCGPAPEFTEEAVGKVVNPVAQFGTEPLVAALDGGAEVVVAGRCCDAAVFAAYPVWKGLDPALALHCAKIAECGALCAVPVGANDSLLCRVAEDHFVVEPTNPDRVCTPESVAAHSLYEQPDPECFHEPEGTVDMRGTVYGQISPRAVRAAGTVLRVPAERTLKLEGVERKGFRAVTIAGISDPAAIAHLDDLEAGVREAVASNLRGFAAEGSYRLGFRRYGLDGAAFFPPRAEAAPREVGLLIEAVASTQELADSVLALARSTALHQPFPGRKATAGNLAFPFSPSDFSCGEVFEFSLYHLVKGEDPARLFRPVFLQV